MQEGFWGLPSPAGAKKAKASVFGAPGPFFRDILRASRYVELYDERLGYEPWRRGVRTDIVSAGSLKNRLEKARSSFHCLIGYPGLPDTGWNEGSRLLLSPKLKAPRGLRLEEGDTVAGLRKAGPRRAAGPQLITAQEILRGGTGIFGPDARPCTILAVDPLVMDSALMELKENSPGGLTWYPLVDLLESCFDRQAVSVVHLLPRSLPRGDAYPAFVLARLVSRIIALALRGRGGG